MKRKIPILKIKLGSPTVGFEPPNTPNSGRSFSDGRESRKGDIDSKLSIRDLPSENDNIPVS